MPSDETAPLIPPVPAPRRTVSKWLLAALGATALALALSQVLRSQSVELSRLATQRAHLDPMAQAVHVQWGLVGHERVAERVLQGRRALEEERRLQAAEVGRRIAALRGTLLAGWWSTAEREARALDADWHLLDANIATRRFDAAASRDAHRLLTEQALQVMDLVSASLSAPPFEPLWATLARHAATPATLATLAGALEARMADIDQRRHTLTLERELAAAALVGTLLLAFGLALASRRLPAAPNDPPRLRERRGHGRRASDRPPSARPAELAADELRALRETYDTESPPRL